MPEPTKTNSNGLGAAAERKAYLDRQRAELAKMRDEEEEGNAYDYDKSLIPPGMAYEWKRYSILGKVDVGHLAKLKRYGWMAVPAARHPELFGVVTNPDEPAIREDRILMERPVEFVRDAHLHSFKQARKNIKDQAAKLKVSSHELLPRRGTGMRSRHEATDIPPDDALKVT